MPLSPRPTVANFELIRLLARGGMSDVYLARSSSRRLVAIKVLNDHRARDPEACALFRDETMLVGVFDHDNLAGVYEAGASAGVPYLAMEYVHGADVREILCRRQRAHSALGYDSALTIVAHAAAGLDHAHRRCGPNGRPLQLVHRDMSLSNIMVSHDGDVKVIDFGIARSTMSLHTTNPGVVRGKSSYMSPEQCVGAIVDRRTDVFALGVVLYELTTGQRCFQGSTDKERMLAVIRGDWVPPSIYMPGFPPVLEQVIATALALDPAERYPSAAAMLDALDAVALLEGWSLGTEVTYQMMRKLFGPMPPPIDVDDTTHVCPPPASPCPDEAPTRGYRSLARSWAAA